MYVRDFVDGVVCCAINWRQLAAVYRGCEAR